ncbi:MAG: T9SS type A sorting domain-containing protein, partial [Bacteroidota bacterium]
GFRAYLDSSMTYGGEYQYLDIPDTLNLGDTIKAGQNFRFQTYCYFWSSAYGAISQPVNLDWLGIGDHYLGLTILLPQDTLYGWVRINVTSENFGYRTTIKDYALDKNPWLGIWEPNGMPGFTMFPNPAKGSITVKHCFPDKSNILTIQNFLGQTIQCQPFNSNKIILDISSLKDGIYLMILTGNHYNQVRKFVVKQ